MNPDESPRVGWFLRAVDRSTVSRPESIVHGRGDPAMRTFRQCWILPLVTVLLAGTVAACGGGSPTFMVNSTNDIYDGACNSTHCSLREAIILAITTPGVSTIKFNIGGGGVQTIHPTSALPAVTVPMIIDGETQPGFQSNPVIEIDGSTIPDAGMDGLLLTGGKITVRGLAINNFGGNGIRIEQKGEDFVGNCFIGTDVNGTAAKPNGAYGIRIDSGDNNAIGALTRNVISGNLGGGILVYSRHNEIQTNLIGLDVNGMIPLGNHGPGVDIRKDQNLVGGDEAGLRNFISDNWGDGVRIEDGAVLVKGNYIGTDITASVALGNHRNGVFVSGSGSIQIGGSGNFEKNVISGNQLYGVWLEEGSDDVSIFGNRIGTNLAGTAALKNIKSGIFVNGTNIEVGSTADGTRNLISGNGGAGITIGDSANGVVVKNNYIGTDITGTTALGNDLGIEAGHWTGAADLVIGGSPLAPNEGNLISGNLSDGVLLYFGAKVWGNKIGTDAAGTGALGNGGNGILVKGSGNQIGGPASGNTIAFNGRHGVAVIDENHVGTHNAIQANSIHDNALLGIAIDEDGVIPNDSLDADSGNNDRQNYPSLMAAFADLGAGTTTFVGKMNSKPNTTYSIEFFSNAACDPSGFGEGQSMFNKVQLTTDAQGYAVINVVSATTDFLFGNFFTLTATDPAGSTSEFSNCVPLTNQPTATDTPGAMVFKPSVNPLDIFQGPCGPNQVQIAVEISNPPKPIGYVLLFVRAVDKKSGQASAWSEGLTMAASGKNNFLFTLAAAKVPDYDKFAEAWLQYQFVAYSESKDKIGFSDVYGDITLKRCGGAGTTQTKKPGMTG
jgi:CSLREA domain-containing protein